MLYVDIPTRSEMTALSELRAKGCVSIYLKVSPLIQETEQSRIELGNFIRDAQTRLEALGLTKREIEPIVEELEELREDDDFWNFQAHSLAIFATPDSIRTWRLPNALNSMLVVSDRLHLKPLFRAITFPNSAFILALSENDIRLIEMHADLPPQVIKVEDMPKDAASAAGKASIKDRSHARRIHGSEGENVRLEQYVRKIDTALRPVLAGRETPLILAATGRLAGLFPQMNSYPHLLPNGISDSPDRMTEAELVAAARPVLDAAYAEELAALRDTYQQMKSQDRATSDVSDAARAATFGAIKVLMVDIDTLMPGQVDEETGAVTFAADDDTTAYGVIDEIAARAHASGARVLGVRREDLPEQHDLAAILRYAF